MNEDLEELFAMLIANMAQGEPHIVDGEVDWDREWD